MAWHGQVLPVLIRLPSPARCYVEYLPVCSAVDNLLLKLAAEGVPFLRIGRLSQVDQRLHAWTPGGSRYPSTSVGGLQATAKAAQVVSLLPPLPFSESSNIRLSVAG